MVQFEIHRAGVLARPVETVGRAKQGPVQKVNDIVRSNELSGVFVVVGVQLPPQKCFIQEFDVSKQRRLDATPILVECSTLIPFTEDASQAAARIVRQATEGR